MSDIPEMVERVKAVLRNEHQCCELVTAAELDEHREQMARAVIAAMREPTEAMIDATETTVIPYSMLDSGATTSDEVWRSMARDNWEAMIEVAMGSPHRS